MNLTEYPRNIQLRIKRMKEKDGLSKRNEELVLKFVHDAYTVGLGSNPVKPLRIEKYFGQMKNIAEWLGKDFDKATIEDMRRVVGIINTHERYGEWTKWGYKVMIKLFWKWLEGNSEEYPDKVKWIKRQSKPPTKVKAKDLITRDELKDLIKAAKNDRDRCLVALLYESGARLGELLAIKIGDINFNDDHAKLTLLTEKGREGETRTIPIVESIPYLAAWLKRHPSKNPDASLFDSVYNIKRANGGIQAHAVYRLMDRISNGKKIYPHLFRHSRATELSQHFTEAQLCAFFGWRPGSRMPGTYLHLSGKTIDNDYLSLYGKRQPTKLEEGLKEIVCFRCGEKNLPTDTQCGRCGLIFEEKQRFEDMNKGRVVSYVMTKVCEADPDLKQRIDQLTRDITRRFSGDIEDIIKSPGD